MMLAIIFTSCKRVVVVVDSVPENTPSGQPIYIAGNFNSWDPGDELFTLSMDDDSNYSFNLPPGIGIVSFKFTRGNWTTVEKDLCGEEIPNRSIEVANYDTLFCTIESWNDKFPINCDHITLIIDELPLTTSKNNEISLACNLNSWNPDKKYTFKKNKDGQLSLTIKRPKDVKSLEYLITRGDISTSESDEYGNPIKNRTVNFGEKSTIHLTVDGWIDKKDKEITDVVLILNNIPENTPVDENIYLSGTINSWRLSDRNFRFTKNKNGNYYVTLPRKRMLMEYKILRKDWSTVETNRYGRDILNRQIDLRYSDTLEINIEKWKDL